MFEKIKIVVKHTFIYGLGTFTSRAIGFLLIPVYTRYLSTADYGALSIISITLSILVIFVTMGVGSSFFICYFNSDAEYDRSKFVSMALMFLNITSLAVALIVVAFARRASFIVFKTENYTYVFMLIGLTLFFGNAKIIPLSLFRVRDESAKYTLFSLFSFLANLIFNIYLVVVAKRGMIGVLEGGMVSYALIWLVTIPVVFRYFSLRFSLLKLWDLLRLGIPLMPAVLMNWVLTLSDRYFLQHFSTLHETGLYDLGYRFGSIASVLIIDPFSLAWATLMFTIARGKMPKETFATILTYLFGILMLVWLGISILAKDAIRIMADPKFIDAYKVVPLVTLSYVLYGLYYFWTFGPALKNRTKDYPYVTACAAIAHLLLNFLLIPFYGMIGAAISTVIGYLIMSLVMLVVCNRFYFVQYEYKRMLKIVLISGGLYFLSMIETRNIFISISSKLFIVAIYPLLLYLFKFYTTQEVLKIRELLLSPFLKVKTLVIHKRD